MHFVEVNLWSYISKALRIKMYGFLVSLKEAWTWYSLLFMLEIDFLWSYTMIDFIGLHCFLLDMDVRYSTMHFLTIVMKCYRHLFFQSDRIDFLIITTSICLVGLVVSASLLIVQIQALFLFIIYYANSWSMNHHEVAIKVVLEMLTAYGCLLHAHLQCCWMRRSLSTSGYLHFCPSFHCFLAMLNSYIKCLCGNIEYISRVLSALKFHNIGLLYYFIICEIFSPIIFSRLLHGPFFQKKGRMNILI